MYFWVDGHVDFKDFTGVISIQIRVELIVVSCRVQWWQLKTSETGEDLRQASERPTLSAMSSRRHAVFSRQPLQVVCKSG